MSHDTASKIIALLHKTPSIQTVDITGGAPELHAEFKYLVKEAHAAGKEIIDRCNLTVFFEANQEETPRFLADHGVRVIASLPCYSKENVEKQRGGGVFGKSIKALQILNDLGYARKGSGLTLDLVFNPLGASLPPNQSSLEHDYKIRLREDFRIEFNQLLTITNMPIKRFLHDLQKQNRYEEYMNLLVQSFNPGAVSQLMCRDTISIGWDGKLYDCDFNQMLDIPMNWKLRTIHDIDSFDELASGDIAFGDHCYGCTAGSGSSCTGALT